MVTLRIIGVSIVSADFSLEVSGGLGSTGR